jgi:short-subunit dehydrogenase
MLARGTHKSAVVNMTSYYADWPTFNAPLYSAGKAAQAHSSYIFGLEYEDEMDILTVKGMPVKSKRNPYGVSAPELVDGVFQDLG